MVNEQPKCKMKYVKEGNFYIRVSLIDLVRLFVYEEVCYID